MEKKDFTYFMISVINDLKQGGYHGTVHVYKNSLNAFIAFNEGKAIPFRMITPELLKCFETYMRQRCRSWNTISTYLRTLRATYNRAVDKHLAPYVPHLFKHVYTGTRADTKRALNARDMAILLNSEQKKEIPASFDRTRSLFVLMFMLRGLPFVDMAYLHKKDLTGNTITYRRRKTGRQLTVLLPLEAMNIVKQYMNTNPDSPYLFPILSKLGSSKETYREYQLALRMFNYQLALLAKILGIEANLSSYTARHTWATLAYYCEIHPGIISEAMGHSSIMVTETYLKPFNVQKINKANMEIINFVKQYI